MNIQSKGRRYFLATAIGAGYAASAAPTQANVSREFLEKLGNYRGLFFACTDRDDGSPLFNVGMDRGTYSLLVSHKGKWERNEKTGLFLLKGFRDEPLEVLRIHGGLTETRGDRDLDGRPDFYKRVTHETHEHTSISPFGGLDVINPAYTDRVTTVDIGQLPEGEAQEHIAAFEADLRALIKAMDAEVKGRGLTPPIPVREKRRC